MDYLYVISCIFWTVATIFITGFSVRFYYGWFEESIKRKIENEKQKTREIEMQ